MWPRRVGLPFRFEFDGNRVTVADYFEREKGIKLKHPDLQCIELRHRYEQKTWTIFWSHML